MRQLQLNQQFSNILVTITLYTPKLFFFFNRRMLLVLFQGEQVPMEGRQGWPRSPCDRMPRGGHRFCRALQGLSPWFVQKLLLLPQPEVGEAVTDGAISVVHRAQWWASSKPNSHTQRW